MPLRLSHIAFSTLVLFLLCYDVSLLYLVAKKRSKKKDDTPTVYILCMTICGILNKASHLLLIDGYVISSGINGEDGYEEYRQFFGKQLSLISTWGYLTPIYFNWLMTIHRVFVVAFPTRSSVFGEFQILGYCIAIKLTWFQNKYTIYFPVSAMIVNFLLIFYMKLKMTTTSNSLIRTVTVTAVYLSIYEIGSLYIRLLPGSFDAQSSDFKDDFYFVRILTICSLNFFVYFVISKASRQAFLDFYGFFKKKQMNVVTVTMQ
ncbi:Protein CBG05580 [Caenorhabditis briggsae]|uniref:Protein CBG05580 n=1 Tax=Caenorhabditis briggsae TaxID=6238 RepID=A8X071_CAEBR|nr:Protein CBG05580 [Caenorhabditis briggsae]CAP26031.1 Protein CBG05580 [Caenorhabditis briggsae]